MFSEHDAIPFSLHGTERFLLIRSINLSHYLVLLATIERLQKNQRIGKIRHVSTDKLNDMYGP